MWGRPLACAGPLDPLLGPKSSLRAEKMAAWEAAAGRGPAPLFVQNRFIGEK
jgi:hypothetical protein